VNRRTAAFRAMFAALPAEIQQAARDAFRMFLANPRHPALRSHPLRPTGKGEHLSGSVSVSVTIKYRAIYVVRDGVNLWYWIGSHADYDAFIGKK
jgi:hypothetical protein